MYRKALDLSIWFLASVVLIYWLITTALAAGAQATPPGCYVGPDDVVWCPVTQVFLPVVYSQGGAS